MEQNIAQQGYAGHYVRARREPGDEAIHYVHVQYCPYTTALVWQQDD